MRFVNRLNGVTFGNVAFCGADAITEPSPQCHRETTDFSCSGYTDVIDVVKTVKVAFGGACVATECC